LTGKRAREEEGVAGLEAVARSWRPVVWGKGRNRRGAGVKPRQIIVEGRERERTALLPSKRQNGMGQERECVKKRKVKHQSDREKEASIRTAKRRDSVGQKGGG